MTTPPDQGPAQISFMQEVYRKATHTAALVIPAGYEFLDLSKKQMLTIMVPITVLMYIIDISRLRGWPLWTNSVNVVFGKMIRRHEIDGDWTGATYILTSVCSTVALFPRPIAVAALAFIMVGDTLAALIGRRFGRHKIGRKSVEGSLACLAGTSVVAFCVPDLPLQIGLLGAVAAAIVEALPLGVDDNITVPLIAGVLMTLAAKIAMLTEIVKNG